MSAKTFACRCEDVTLHELEEAIDAGHRDIESLKRYTGYGTGWCQGKWCQAVCARVLSEKGGQAELPFTPRPPFHPTSLARLAAISDEPDEPREPREPREPHEGTR